MFCQLRLAHCLSQMLVTTIRRSDCPSQPVRLSLVLRSGQRILTSTSDRFAIAHRNNKSINLHRGTWSLFSD